jgi:hypothetical protein
MYAFFAILSIILVITFLILHIVALITSFYCFKYGVNVTSIFGFLIVIFMGPFFWLYYSFAKNYCKELYNVNPMT